MRRRRSEPARPTPPAASWRRSLGICLLLVAGVVIVYGPVGTFEFVSYDDPAYVYENEHVTAGLTWEGVRWALTTGFEGNWLPLSRLSHMLDCQLFGLHAGAHHVVNVLLHGANALLLYGVLQAMTGAAWSSAWVAAVFALHPVHVESVAWVSERKDVLSTLFGLLCLWSYLRYVRRPGWRPYAAAVLAFVGSLLAKQMWVTLPVLLLLLDVWPLGRLPLPGGATPAPRGRVRGLVLEKVPFVLAAVAAGCVAVLIQAAEGSVLSTATLSVRARLENAAVAYVRYLGKLLWPTSLTFFYPYRSWTAPQVVGATVLLGALTVGALWSGRRRPYVLVGWLWYVLTLLPVIGIVQVGSQAMADRYTYLPSVGVCLVVAWGVAELAAARSRWRVALAGAAVAAVTLCMAAAATQVQVWRTSQMLFTRALAVEPDSYIAHNNLGHELAKQGRLDEAIVQYRAALASAPGDARARRNLGLALRQQGDLAGAIAQLDAAARLRPTDAQTQQALADALAQVGRFADAIPHYREAIARGLTSPALFNNFGVVLANGGDLEGALGQFQAALAIDRTNTDAHVNAARALTELDRRPDAVVHLEAVARSRPDDAEAHLRLAELLMQLGRRDEARAEIEWALRLRPGWSGAEALLRAPASEAPHQPSVATKSSAETR